MSYKIVGAEDILARGVSSLSQLRPVLGANTDPLAANATLRKDEWERIDARVNDVARQRLTITNDLRARGLVTPVSLGTMLRVTERLQDFDDADVSYDGDASPSSDRPDFLRQVIPVPVIAKDWKLSWRQLDASRTMGESLDVTASGIAARKVADQMENIIVNGFGRGPGTNPSNGTDGQTIPGLTTAANRLAVSIGTAWDLSGGDPIGNVTAMLDAAYNVNLFGPFNLYLPKNYWATVQEDYVSDAGAGTSTRTVMQRILEFVDIQAVRPLDALADDNVVMLQMTEDVIDLTEAQAITTVQWEKNPFVQLFRALSVGGPHIKSIETEDGVTINGIVHLS